MRTYFLLAALAACGSSPKPQPEPTHLAQYSPPVKPAEPPPPEVDARPDAPPVSAHQAELAKVATTMVEAFSNGSPAFITRDGTRLVFTSSRDGLPQLYLADTNKPEAPATRLVESAERVGGAVLLPDGKSLVFMSDHGADELWSIFRIGLDGKGLVELTSQKLRRDVPQVADGKPDMLFYSARANADVGTAVYAASATAPGDEKQLFHDDKPGFLVDVTRDGKRGLYERYPSRSENYVVTIDLATGTTTPIYPKDGQVSISAAAFSADGKRVFVGTDGGGEQALVLAFDAASGKELARYVEKQPATATISSISVAKRGNLIAVGLDAGNRGEIRLLDATTLAAKAAVKMPLGSGSAGPFSEDGRRLVAAWSTPELPSELFAVDAASGKVTPLRKESRPALDRMPGIEVSSVEIEAFDHLKLPTNVYLPAGAKDKKLPVIVSYHGGPAGSSAIRWNPIARFFLAQGYAWIEPNVRGSGGFGRAFEAADNGAKRLDAFQDIETTGKWAATQPWADRERVVVFGGSYGGYTVLVGLTRQPRLWRAGVDLFGVANLKTFMATTSGLIREIFLVEFGDPDKDADFLDSISPLRDADKIVRPLFVYAGANDPRVPRSESDLIVKAMRGRHVPVEYMVKDNEGHSLSHRENQVELMARSARFLEQHLR
jgi:dipeptidyl aminopeptidase/acylaminoacyl peptidase